MEMTATREYVSGITPNPRIEAIAQFVEGRMRGEGSGHDWFHVERVRRAACQLAKLELFCDAEVVELAALLHDIPDRKLHPDPPKAMLEIRERMELVGCSSSVVEHVLTIVEGVSYKGAGVETPMSTIEGCVVQDADRLDALGAIGVARCFAYGGRKGRLLHDPAQKPVLHTNAEAYHSDDGPSLNHFYEKLFLLKDRMLTESGKKAAAKRHRFLQEFEREFLSEWDGRDLLD